MNSDALFGMALGLQELWEVTEVSFKAEAGQRPELHLRIGFASGSKFKYDAGVDCAVHDTLERQWQHLNFFEYRCFLHCRVPRISTSDGRFRNADVPWSRAGSCFTLLFEAFALALIEREMPVSRVAQILGITPQRIWTVFAHWVDKARLADDPSSITKLGVDDTSSKKGHSGDCTDYVWDSRNRLVQIKQNQTISATYSQGLYRVSPATPLQMHKTPAHSPSRYHY